MKRREFIKTSAALSASAGVIPISHARIFGKQPFHRVNGVEYSVVSGDFGYDKRVAGRVHYDGHIFRHGVIFEVNDLPDKELINLARPYIEPVLRDNLIKAGL